ncbi:hypothetical protein ASPZODRAFT_104204 [Penicilliopsis zonata CBS 506.65]|uniref:Uncharacterized protein n=1 Tax=Penicilliopsis zonata CBS 506.65 TaxID=1073090 RepID=A0A1L9S709_9EURO|nr:hypothetical protein ASPZODRAFT_104204 [Penicilliopsis zonata CBS 506.65]OJJ42928.1 hypothetical protein ASPZODRAFT_104204 [Penicilliopsis zonata CBS 506.65]
MDPASLLCSICPKQPQFSDVSHLLTHVSSKAHLSHYFKLQVRSHQEPGAGDLLNEYDRWYKFNDIARLLSNRMTSKEARKRRVQSKATAHGATRPIKKDTDKRAIKTPTSLPEFLDPRLSDPYSRPSLQEDIGHSFDTTSYPPPSTVPKAYFNEQDEIQTLASGSIIAPSWKREHELDSGDESLSILQSSLHWPETPRIRSKLPTVSFSAFPGVAHDPFVDDNENDANGEVDIDKERADEMARLKGILWPGMDIFDSATEQMRRKRNQKKDESILRMMERTSLCIEPTELVFSPTGILRRQRVISGNVEDSSPLKGETPVPKRRASRPKRGALSQTDPNIAPGCVQGNKRVKKEQGHAVKTLSPNSSLSSTLFLRSPVPLHSLSSRNGFYPSSYLEDDNEDLRLSMAVSEPKARGGFPVFHDEQHSAHNVGFKNHRSETTSDSSNPFLPRPETSVFNSMSTFAASTYPLRYSGETGLNAAGKENVEPVMNGYGKIETPGPWHSPLAKRSFSGDMGLPSQVLFGDLGGVEFGAFEDLSGYSFNPLVASFSRLAAHEPHLYAPAKTPEYEQKPAARIHSPNGTISDIEHDDFERLYLDGSTH